LVEQRIVLLAIVQARETGRGLNPNDFVSITAKNYAARYNAAEEMAYTQLKEAAKTLYDREFTLYDNDVDTGNPEVITSRWLSARSYVDGAGIIKLQFSPAIVPYITRLEKEFTRYQLEKVAYMSSAYAIRLYELLIQWGSTGYREIELEQLRKILMVVDEYKAIKDLKKWVIDIALSQINEYSDLAVSYTQRKTGRVVTHLIFKFDQKEEPKPEPKPAVKPGFEKTKATREELAVEFLKNNAKYQRDHSNIAPHIAWRTPAIWSQFAVAFEEWACVR
jgi:plasmid replication initiation protein